jgi:hypothetical protein
LGKPHHSIPLYINACNSSFPRDNLICAAILFGEKDYFLNKKIKSNLPPEGWRLKEFY